MAKSTKKPTKKNGKKVAKANPFPFLGSFIRVKVKDVTPQVLRAMSSDAREAAEESIAHCAAKRKGEGLKPLR